MSKEANDLMFWMIKQLSTMGYGYREIVEGCYDTGINNYGFKLPEESKQMIVDKVIMVLSEVS